MKILHLVQKPQRRGAEMFAFQLSGQQRQKGHQVRTIYLYSPNEKPLPLRDGDQIVGNSDRHFTEKFPGWNPSIVRELRSIITDFQPDIVQLNGARTVKYGALLRFLDKTNRWILVYRNIGDPRIWLRGFWRKWLYQKFLVPRINGIVAVSETTLGVLESIYSGREIVVIPRGIDPGFFSPKATREAFRKLHETLESSPLLIYVGSLSPEKRVDRLLRVFSMAFSQIPELRLWIVGDGVLRKEMENLAKELNIHSSVQFFGMQEDVATFVNAADLLLLTSDTEGIPGVILEAGLLGVPSIATRVGGVAECAVDGETAILVDQEDEKGMAAAVIQLVTDANRRKTMGKKAQQWIHQRFTLSTVGKAYDEFYERLLKGESRINKS